MNDVQIKNVIKKLEKIEDYFDQEQYILKERIEHIEDHIRQQDQEINTQDTAILKTGRMLHKNGRAIAKIWFAIKNLDSTYQKI